MKEWLAAAMLVVGVVVFISSLTDSQAPGDTRRAARRVERVLERRMDELDGFVQEALAQKPDEWLSLEGLPQDFVIYRYCNDTLQSWCNEFLISNDRVDVRVFVPFIGNPSVPAESPLLQVSDRLGFCNLGPRWYLAKWVGNKDMRVIAGLEISNEAPLGRIARVSRYLRLPARFSIRPLSENGGTAVVVRGRPQFKIIQESLSGSGRDASPLLWVSVVAVLIAFLVFLSARRTRRRFFSVAPGHRGVRRLRLYRPQEGVGLDGHARPQDRGARVHGRPGGGRDHLFAVRPAQHRAQLRLFAGNL